MCKEKVNIPTFPVGIEEIENNKSNLLDWCQFLNKKGWKVSINESIFRTLSDEDKINFTVLDYPTTFDDNGFSIAIAIWEFPDPEDSGAMDDLMIYLPRLSEDNPILYHAPYESEDNVVNHVYRTLTPLTKKFKIVKKSILNFGYRIPSWNIMKNFVEEFSSIPKF